MHVLNNTKHTQNKPTGTVVRFIQKKAKLPSLFL